MYNVVAVEFVFLLPDNYVHRIVQNKSDGKLVEVSGQQGMVKGSNTLIVVMDLEGGRGGSECMRVCVSLRKSLFQVGDDEKIDSLQLEVRLRVKENFLPLPLSLLLCF